MTLLDTHSKYFGNAAYYGGIALCDGCLMQISNANYAKIVGRFGGAYYLKNGPTMTLTNSVISNSSAIEEGGFIFGYELVTGTIKGTITMSILSFTDTLAGKNGGVVLLNTGQIKDVQFNQITVYNSIALGGNGGALYISQRYDGSFSINKGTFKKVYAKIEGSLFYSDSPTLVLDMMLNDVYCQLNYNSTFIEEYRLNNSFQIMSQAGAFYINGARNVTSTLNKVQECFIANQGSIYLFKNVGLFRDTTSTYLDGVAKQGGAIYCDSCNMIISKISFMNFKAKNGGTIVLDNKSNMDATMITISDSYSISQGGAFTIFQSDISGTGFVNKVNIYLCETLINIRSDDLGGFVYMSNSLTELYLSSMNIDHMYANRSGGVLYIEKGKHLEIKDLNVFEIGARYGAIAYSVAPDFTFNITQSKFACFQQFFSSIVDKAIDIYTPDSGDLLTPPSWVNFESVFYIQNSKLVNSDSNTYQNCYVAKDGGVFSLVQSTMKDVGSVFQNNAALNGGAINCNECNLFLLGTLMYKNFAYTGGTIFIQKNGYANLKLCKIKENRAYKEAGALYLTQSSYFDLLGTQFISNKAYQSSAIEIFGGSIFYNSTAIDTLFIQNNALNSFTLKMDQGTMVVQGSTFRNNNAGRRAKNIFTVFSKIYILNTKFIDDGYTLINQGDNINNFFGGYIFFGVNSFGYIQGSTFSNGEAYNGGCIYISSEATIKINGTTFQNSYAKKYGGAIYSQASYDVSIYMDSKFLNNIAYEQGDHIYFSESLDYSIFVTDTYFTTSNAQSSAFFAENVKQVIMTGVTFSDITRADRLTSINYQYGGAVRCNRCLFMMLKNSLFNNIKSSNYGGAVYVRMLDQFKRDDKKIPAKPSFLIDGSTFVDCEASQGGVLFNDNGDYFEIKDSTFIQNRAIYNPQIGDSGTAGALYYFCNVQIQQCFFNLTGTNTFYRNKADLQGGAIHWQLQEVKFNQNYTKFANNTALIYGDDVSCVPQKIVYLTKEQFEANRQKRIKAEEAWKLEGRSLFGNDNYRKNRRLQSVLDKELTTTEAESDKQRSGGLVPETYLAVVDMFGRIVGSNQGGKLWVNIDDNYKQDPDKSLYPPVIEGQNTFFSQNGTFNVTGLQFTGAPGKNYTLQFETDAINFQVPSNREYQQMIKATQGKPKVQFDLDVNFRNCSSGESFTSAGKCVICPEGDYFSIVPMGKPGDCIKCPTEQAICLGGDRIGPRPGYWRKSNETDKFLKCFNKDACLGYIEPNWNPVGECAEGYQGYLCSDCWFGWSKTSATSFKCALCPPMVSNSVKLGGTMIVYIGLLVMLVRSTLQGAKQQKSVTSIYMKILMNHLQLIGIVQSFNFKFPDTLTKYMSSASSAGDSAGSQILSLDCYLDTRKKESDILSIKIYYQKMIVISLIPILIFVNTFIVWNILKKIYERSRRKRLGKEWVAKLKEASYIIQNGDVCEKAVAIVKQRELVDQATYHIGGKMISSIIILLFFIHPTIVQYSISDFACVDIDGETRLKPDLNISCWVGEHWFYTYSVVLPCLVIWGLGIPFFALIMLMRHKNTLTKIETKEMFGFLYNGYKRENYFWEIIIMYRKIVLIFISIFLQSQGVICQAMVVFAILILFLVLNMKVRPFGVDALNDLETLSVVTQIITIYCGIFFITDVSDTLANSESMTTSMIDAIKGQGIVLSEFVKNVLFFSILIANLAFFLYWGIKLMKEVKGMLINKIPKIYVFCCLCNDNEKFKDQQRKQKIKEQNDLLKEEYERTLKRLLALQETGKLILSENMVERINMYLNEDKFLDAIKYNKTERLTDKQAKRLMRQKNILDAKNKFMTAQVVPQKDLDLLTGPDGMYKDYDQKLLQLDKNFMKGKEQAFHEDDLSSNIEETKEPMLDEKQIWSDDNKNIIFDSSSESESGYLSGDLKQNENKKKKGDNRPQWEIEYIRKRRGSLNEKELEEELWEDKKNKNITDLEKKKKLEELKRKQEEEAKKRQFNNFLIPTEVDVEDTGSVEGKRDKNKKNKYNIQEQINKDVELGDGVRQKVLTSKEKLKRKQRIAKEINKKENQVKNIRKKDTKEMIIFQDSMMIEHDVILDDLEKIDKINEEDEPEADEDLNATKNRSVNSTTAHLTKKISSFNTSSNNNQMDGNKPVQEEEDSQNTDDYYDEEDEQSQDWSEEEANKNGEKIKKNPESDE